MLRHLLLICVTQLVRDDAPQELKDAFASDLGIMVTRRRAFYKHDPGLDFSEAMVNPKRFLKVPAKMPPPYAAASRSVASS